jgi:hypothetical protein
MKKHAKKLLPKHRQKIKERAVVPVNHTPPKPLVARVLVENHTPPKPLVARVLVEVRKDPIDPRPILVRVTKLPVDSRPILVHMLYP